MSMAPASLRAQPPIPEGEWPERPERASQTLLAHFQRCRRAAYLNLKYKGGAGSAELDRGTALHRFIERTINAALDANEPRVPPDLARAILEEVMAEPDLTIAAEETDGLRMMAHHVAEYLVIDPSEVVAVERLVHLQVGEWTVSMKIDFAWAHGETVGIWDWKSSAALPDQSAWGEAESDSGKQRVRRFQFQTLIYALGAVYGRPVSLCENCGDAVPEDRGCAMPDCEGGWVYEDTPLAPRANLIELSEVYPFYVFDNELARRTTTIRREDLDDHMTWLRGVLGKLDHAFETGEWPAVPGSHCSMCPARRECPLPETLRGPEGAAELDAEAAAALWLRLKDEQAALWAQLKAHGELGEPLVVGDKVFAYDQEERREVRRSKGKADWDGLVAEIARCLETGEEFDEAKWIKSRVQTPFKVRTLKPGERVEGASDAAVASNDGTLGVSPSPEPVDLDAKYGETLPI